MPSLTRMLLHTCSALFRISHSEEAMSSEIDHSLAVGTALGVSAAFRSRQESSNDRLEVPTPTPTEPKGRVVIAFPGKRFARG